MYSFAQRSDTTVLDEPLYANYLKMTGLQRPYRDQVLAAQETDGNKVVRDQILAPRSKAVLYVKHMAKHKVGVDQLLFQRANHILLVRDPYSVVMSFSKVLQPTLLEIGYSSLLEIYSDLRTQGRPPLVVLSDDLVRHPEPMLRSLCAALGIAFQPSMLTWAAGPKPYDGLWAPWWYGNSHRSTGFDAGYRDGKEPLPERLKPLLGECWPMFEMLRDKALTPLVEDAVPRPLRQAVQGLSLGSDGSGDSHSQQHHHGSLHKSVSWSSAQAVRAVDAAAGSGAGGGASGRLPPRQGLLPVPADASVAAPDKSIEKSGTHCYQGDPRNADILVGIRDGFRGCFDLVWRPQAKVSVLDSAFMLGDGMWEGIRLHKGVLMFAGAHLARLWEGAMAIDMDMGISQRELLQLIYNTVDANGMASASDVHIRLMVSRGLKPTPYQNPNTTLGKPTIVVLPEWKAAAPGPKEKGIRLFTVHIRRGPPDVQDPGWNSHSKLNCIAACIQANKAGADEALMLDTRGFVATCNSVNFFIVRDGEVWAPRGVYQMRGVTRANILQLCSEEGVQCRETDFYLTQVYSADEAFVTGTFAGVLPVREVDGRRIGNGKRGPLTAALQQLYARLVDQEAAHGRQGLEAD